MEQHLTKFKNIQPNKDFQERSKQLILAAAQLEPTGFTLPQWLSKAVFAPALATILLILGGLSALLNGSSPSLADSLNQENLAAEVKSLDIQIQLSQVQYYQDSIKKIEVALQEISGESEL